jgi:hypothetical protein
MDPYGLKQFGFAGCDNDPAKWNETWEWVIKMYGSTNVLQIFKTRGVTDANVNKMLLNHMSRLCDFRHCLTIHAAPAFAKGDFESK